MPVGWCFRESCHLRLQESESQPIARTIRAENGAWPGAGEHSAETSLGAADTSVRATSSPTNSSRCATKLTCSSTSVLVQLHCTIWLFQLDQLAWTLIE